MMVRFRRSHYRWTYATCRISNAQLWAGWRRRVGVTIGVGACRYRRNMTYDFQITIDSNTPHSAAKWWAAALGWRVEPSDEDFIRRTVDAGHATEDDTEIFEGVLVWKAGAAISDPENPARPRVLFQWVPETKTVKNRAHLDIRAGEDREKLAARLVTVGAVELHRGSQGPYEWITMADPWGNEFCLT